MKYELTKEQLRSLTDPKVKEWFPEVFKPVLEVGKYYKHPNYPKFLTCLREDKTRFGIDVYGNWFDYGELIKDEHQKGYKEATEQEVFESLKNEAVKRGFVENAYYKNIQGYLAQCAHLQFGFGGIHSLEGDGMIFQHGKWAEIIPTKTKAEAEKELNCKIVD